MVVVENRKLKLVPHYQVCLVLRLNNRRMVLVARIRNTDASHDHLIVKSVIHQLIS